MTNVIPPGFQIHAEQVTADGRDVRLELLRAPFEPHQISKVPKPTKEQSDEKTRSYWIRCEVCDGWHNPQVKHLDYVGHAALTDRLLQADPYWYWEPLALDNQGLPRFDSDGGLWIKLTICGITRLGYGHAEEKATMDKGARIKEVIGDAMRNAAMRFGAALDLWHKGDLHKEEAGNGDAPVVPKEAPPVTADSLYRMNNPTLSPLSPAIVKRLTDTLSLSALQQEFGQLDTESRRVHYSVFDGHRKALTARQASIISSQQLAARQGISPREAGRKLGQAINQGLIELEDDAARKVARKDSADLLKEDNAARIQADLDGPYGPSGV